MHYLNRVYIKTKLDCSDAEAYYFENVKTPEYVNASIETA